jgi:hypothetical protein
VGPDVTVAAHRGAGSSSVVGASAVRRQRLLARPQRQSNTLRQQWGNKTTKGDRQVVTNTELACEGGEQRNAAAALQLQALLCSRSK